MGEALARVPSRDDFAGQREHDDLRAELFLNIVRYGNRIYPRTRDFMDRVGFTMKALGRIDDEKEAGKRLGTVLGECKGLVKNGKTLEAQHTFMKGKLGNLQTKFSRAQNILDKDQQVLLHNADKFDPPYVLKWLRFKNGESAMQCREEAAVLGTALKNIEIMRSCCMEVLNIIHFVNALLLCCVADLGETQRQIGGFQEMSQAGEDTKHYFEELKEGARELEGGLLEFGDGQEVYTTVIAAIELREPPNETDEITWNAELRAWIKAKESELEE